MNVWRGCHGLDENPLGQTVERGGRSFEVIGVVGDIRGLPQGARGGGPDRDPRAAVYFGQSTAATNDDAARPCERSAHQYRVHHSPGSAPAGSSLAIQQYVPYGTGLLESVAPTRLAPVLATLFALMRCCSRQLGSTALAHRRRRAWQIDSAWPSAPLSQCDRTRAERRHDVVGRRHSRRPDRARRRHTYCRALVCVPRDPVTFVTVGSAVLLVALAASAIPARAVNIDPTIAMRTE